MNSVDFDNELIDGVIVASTTKSHYKIGKKILDLNIPVLIEKPVSQTPEINLLLNQAKEKYSI